MVLNSMGFGVWCCWIFHLQMFFIPTALQSWKLPSAGRSSGFVPHILRGHHVAKISLYLLGGFPFVGDG